MVATEQAPVSVHLVESTGRGSRDRTVAQDPYIVLSPGSDRVDINANLQYTINLITWPA